MLNSERTPRMTREEASAMERTVVNISVYGVQVSGRVGSYKAQRIGPGGRGTEEVRHADGGCDEKKKGRNSSDGRGFNSARY